MKYVLPLEYEWDMNYDIVVFNFILIYLFAKHKLNFHVRYPYFKDSSLYNKITICKRSLVRQYTSEDIFSIPYIEEFDISSKYFLTDRNSQLLFDSHFVWNTSSSCIVIHIVVTLLFIYIVSLTALDGSLNLHICISCFICSLPAKP